MASTGPTVPILQLKKLFRGGKDGRRITKAELNACMAEQEQAVAAVSVPSAQEPEPADRKSKTEQAARAEISSALFYLMSCHFSP